jgi:hypothetical protein
MTEACCRLVALTARGTSADQRPSVDPIRSYSHIRRGQHRDMAALDLGRVGAHALPQEALQLRLDSAVVLGHDVRARLRLPRDAWGFWTNMSAAGAKWVTMRRVRDRCRSAGERNTLRESGALRRKQDFETARSRYLDWTTGSCRPRRRHHACKARRKRACADPRPVLFSLVRSRRFRTDPVGAA